MKNIEHIERQLPSKHKELLYSLRENNWNVIEVNDEYSDCSCHWAYEHKWVVASTRENFGFLIQLWFFKYNGIFDGFDCVVATTLDITDPDPYCGSPRIEFEGKKFELQLRYFLNQIHNLRIHKQ